MIPSNSKPVYVSEKNVIYPNKEEIASLEYYEENFVWGKLQRTDEEYPYPYGIYGSENWYQNRSGKYGGYEDGGSGKGVCGELLIIPLILPSIIISTG